MKKVYILLGDDKSGKTTFQKYLIEELLGIKYTRMQSDLLIDVSSKYKYPYIYFIGRSIQERPKIYKKLEQHINKIMECTDTCFFLSSHLVYDDIIKLVTYVKEWTDNITFIYLINNKYTFLNKLVKETRVRQHYTLLTPYTQNWKHVLKYETKSFISRELYGSI